MTSEEIRKSVKNRMVDYGASQKTETCFMLEDSMARWINGLVKAERDQCIREVDNHRCKEYGCSCRTEIVKALKF